jgi:hypothetical protein
MAMLHVVADVRGEWGVFEDASRRPLSLHATATEAEFVAWGHADDRGSERIVVHDRYGRTRAAVGARRADALKHRRNRRRGAAWTATGLSAGPRAAPPSRAVRTGRGRGSRSPSGLA